MSTQTPNAVRDYLARVRTALADLPPAELDEVLEDVRPHLVELATELGESASLDALIERLGSPESYAAELRAAGDYPAPAEAPHHEPRNTRLAARLAVWSLAACVLGVAVVGYFASYRWGEGALGALLVFGLVLIAGGWYVRRRGTGPVGALPEVRGLRSLLTPPEGGRPDRFVGYLRSLQPAWWLLCAAVLTVLGLMVLRRSGSALIVLVLMVGLAAVVVWAGPRSGGDRRWLWLTLPVSALAVGALFGLGDQMVNSAPNSGYSGAYRDAPENTIGGQPTLSYGSDTVENLYVFDAQGKPLTDVYLYTQDGRPLTLPRYACEPSTGASAKRGQDNRFPRPHIELFGYDDQGSYNGYNAYRPGCRENTEVPFAAAIPKPAAPVPAPVPGPVPAPSSSVPAPVPAPPAPVPAPSGATVPTR
jgi:hypothetical protein